MSIRLKVILPYLILTLIVAVIGVYVVTRLLSTTLSERLINQLIQSGRVVSDGFAKKEIEQAETARVISFTSGIATSLASEKADTLFSQAEIQMRANSIDTLVFFSPQGNEVLHLWRNELGIVERASKNSGMAGLSFVTELLTSKNIRENPRRFMGLNSLNDEYYFYTSIPVSQSGEFAGVIVIGTTIQNMLPDLKSSALADIVIYGVDGSVIATTLNVADPSNLQAISITYDNYQRIMALTDVVTGNNISIDRRLFSLARGPLQVGNNKLGVFAVALPVDFVTDSADRGRFTYTFQFAVLFFIVIGIGFWVSRQIIDPLYRLVNTSQAISAGDLEQRTGIISKDEIGILAKSFDGMTANLQERTVQLERANQILKNIDKTKSNFIQISAHELRTPLTLIMGYSQMLEQDARNDPELKSLAQGILDGSERMTSIVESMLDVSRIDSNALFLRKTGLRIDLIIKKVHKSFDKALVERNIQFIVNDLRDLPLIPADPDMLQKVFYHIIMNAIKFTPDGGSITVSGKMVDHKAEPSVEISIRDTGIGINPDMHHVIFEKFNQTGDVLLHSSGKTKFKGGGPGLGLAIARGIVEAHGGHIWVESPGYDEQTNPGSTFYVSLPAPVEKNEEVIHEQTAS
ncbi:MAG: HAMP domain-containing protein [Anaerolineales bacterium]|uniref:HAMP domain-containing sensor histidine kinase n=1 Tax=Candidatus Villigracilis affinis TaxID=3140682 RepID=UPI001B448ABB|nr:HAMP domain-containing protein [Anaerolineales bacterium]MBK9600392.1 HAMP domain-containing protein [Anaerolineales bacterium]MBL0346846.1 HAMP domain-containing protein [Anaerolineales bacterium]MBP8048294.1 HAMP domain-containing protein [Anaerolineales bacterium]